MIKIIFIKEHPQYMFFETENITDRNNILLLKKHLNLVPNICYLPQFRGFPYTEDFLFSANINNKQVFFCSKGLYIEVYNFFRNYNISYCGLFDNKDEFKINSDLTLAKLKDIIKVWNLNIEPREYQIEAAYKILTYKLSLSQIATRAGKTLISYIVFRYSMLYMNVKKILMIVPSIDLVKQAVNDFSNYGEFFNTEAVWSGGKLAESSNMTVGTFQSLIKFIEPKDKKYNPSFYNDFDLVFVDETHRASASQINRILKQPFIKNVKIRFGMSGTLPKEHTIESYCVQALLGGKIQEITPKELMDNNYISDIIINQIQIKYKNIDNIYIKCLEYCLSDYVLKDNKKVKLETPSFLLQYDKVLPKGLELLKQKDTKLYIKYLQNAIKDNISTNQLVVEKMMVHFMDKRIEILKELLLTSINKNCLILAHHTIYIDYIVDILQNYFPNRAIYKITGKITSKKRQKIIEFMCDKKDCILVASYGCMSTGITIPNLFFGVLFESFKSNVVNMQSLGRGLGKSDGKDLYTVYDFVDILPTKKLYSQGKERQKIYNENQYKYIIKEYY